MIKNSIYAGLLFIIAFVSWSVLKNNTDKRKLYDEFIVKEQSKFFKNTNTKSLVKPDNPGMAMMQNYFMLIDPEIKRVPSERLSSAYDKTKKLKAGNDIDFRDNIEWNKVQSNMGGRVRGIMWDPNTANKIWACSVTGGLYYNNNLPDANSNWEVVDNFWPGLSVSCIAYDPNNTKIFYVGTGEYHTARNIYRESSGVGYGIWRTTDGGETWEIMESTKDFKYISDIKVVDDNGKSVIYAGVVSGKYKNKLNESKPSEGLYRSNNNGEDWEQVLPKISSIDEYYAPSDLEIAANGKIFVGTMKNINGKGGATILSSNSGKKGTWKV